MEKQRREWDTRRPKYAVYRRRRRIALLVLVLLATLVLGGLGAYHFLGATGEDEESVERVVTPTVEQPPEAVVEEETVQEEGSLRRVDTLTRCPRLAPPHARAARWRRLPFNRCGDGG